MDPNEALRQIRELITELQAVDFDDERIPALTNAVSDLDSWLSAGGYLPDAWKRFAV